MPTRECTRVESDEMSDLYASIIDKLQERIEKKPLIIGSSIFVSVFHLRNEDKKKVYLVVEKTTEKAFEERKAIVKTKMLDKIREEPAQENNIVKNAIVISECAVSVIFLDPCKMQTREKKFSQPEILEDVISGIKHLVEPIKMDGRWTIDHDRWVAFFFQKNRDAINLRKQKSEIVDPSIRRHCGFTKETAKKIAENFRKDKNIEHAEAYQYTLQSEAQEKYFENWCVLWREAKRRDSTKKHAKDCTDELLTSPAQYECLLDKMKSGEKLTREEIDLLEELSYKNV